MASSWILARHKVLTSILHVKDVSAVQIPSFFDVPNLETTCSKHLPRRHPYSNVGIRACLTIKVLLGLPMRLIAVAANRSNTRCLMSAVAYSTPSFRACSEGLLSAQLLEIMSLSLSPCLRSANQNPARFRKTELEQNKNVRQSVWQANFTTKPPAPKSLKINGGE